MLSAYSIKKSTVGGLILFLVIALFAFAGVASGHGLGQTFEKIVGEYLIDVDVDEPILQAGEPIRFNFNILTKDKASLVEFTDAWVRISSEEKLGVVFASDLHRPEFGLTGMTYVFPRGGEYELSVRFQKNEGEIAEEVSFSLTVGNNPNISDKSSFFVEFFIGLFLGALITGVIVFFKKK